MNKAPFTSDEHLPAYPAFNCLRNKRVVLASTSPRRIELFRRMGLNFEIIPSNFSEDFDKVNFPSARNYCEATCREKGETVLERLLKQPAKSPVSLLVSSDTIVVHKEQIFEKPVDRMDAIRMLRELNGKTVQVFTAVCIFYLASLSENNDNHSNLMLTRKNYEMVSFVEETKMHMANYDDSMIEAFLDQGQGMDHSGGLAYQGAAFLLVNSIDGCFYNLIGFPAARFYQEFKAIAPYIASLET